jgi:Protein of unknown function (DUF3558)
MMSTLRLRVATLAPMFLILVLAACGGTNDASTQSTAAADEVSSSQPAATDGEAAATEADGAAGSALCALVPIDQVETALGMSTDGGIDDESFISGGLTCRFTGDEDHVLDVETSEQTRDEWFEAIETVGLTDEEVTGVGEEAYRAAETALGGPGARFTAWADGREVGVTIYSDEPQDVTFAAAQAIAEAVLAASE